MQTVQADITAFFSDNTDGVGTGTALLHVEGTVPPVTGGIIKETAGLRCVTVPQSSNVTICNVTMQVASLEHLPFDKTTAIFPQKADEFQLVMQQASKGGQLHIEGDNRSWVDRMSLLMHQAHKTPELFVGMIDMPAHGEVSTARHFLNANQDALLELFDPGGSHVLLVDAVCSATQYMTLDEHGVRYDTKKVRHAILEKLTPFSTVYHTSVSDAFACLFGTAHVGSEVAHCWLQLPIEHDAVKAVLPYAASSVGVDSSSIVYRQSNGGLTFKAEAGHFYIAIVLEATSDIEPTLPPSPVHGPDLDIVMQLLDAQTDEQVGYPYYSFLRRRDGMRTSRDSFARVLCEIGDQRKRELDHK